MATVHSRDTGPERRVRSTVHQLGARFRVRNRDLPGSPDLANRVKRWVIFVHGCFWHGHQGCARAMLPKTNQVYWREKFRKNRARDHRVIAALEREGYRVLVIWECELERMVKVRARIRRFIAGALRR